MKHVWREIQGKKPVITLAVSSSEDKALCEADQLDSVDLFEFRADLSPFYSDPECLKEEISKLTRFKKSILLTVRSPLEGGQADSDEEKRYTLYKSLLPICDFADIEVSSSETLSKIANEFPEKGIIGSFHDFKATPSTDDLNKTYEKGKELGADLIKFACLPVNESDVQNLLRFCFTKRDELISVISMGELGAASRVFFPLAGSLLTYTFSGKPTAPGQLNLRRLSQLVREFYPLKK